jgi:hypothetical protein
MKITATILRDIDRALKEATVLDVRFDRTENRVTLLIVPIAVDEEGKKRPDNHIILTFKSVSRFAASYRLGRWDDKKAEVIRLEPEEIQQNVRDFPTFEIYGQGFIDSNEHNFENSENRLSFNYLNNNTSAAKHSFEFSRDTDNYLAVKIWFNELAMYDLEGSEIDLQKFITDNKRAWGSPTAMEQFGIMPLVK